MSLDMVVQSLVLYSSILKKSTSPPFHLMTKTGRFG